MYCTVIFGIIRGLNNNFNNVFNSVLRTPPTSKKNKKERNTQEESPYKYDQALFLWELPIYGLEENTQGAFKFNTASNILQKD